MTTIKVTLGSRASSFFDPTTNIKVLRGDVVELSEKQQQSKRIAGAINTGHLVKSSGKIAEEKPEISIEDLQAKFKASKDKYNGDADKVKGDFNLEELKAIAISYEIEPEEGDTKAELVAAILLELEEQE